MRRDVLPEGRRPKSYTLRWYTLRWYVLALSLLALDQWSKSVASAQLEYGVPVEITSFFNITLAHNPGAAFSFLSDAGGWQHWLLGGIAGVVSLVLVVWIYRLRAGSLILATGLALILSGAIGNLIDRIHLGYVVDFIQLHYQGWYWPAFNVADSAISIGAVLLLLDSFGPFSERDSSERDSPERGFADISETDRSQQEVSDERN